MPIPDYETLMLPVLKLFAAGAINVSQCLPEIKAQYNISEDEAAELLPSGRVTLLASRTHWARTYLSKAGLLSSPRRNQHVITPLGREILKNNPDRIDNSRLRKQLPEFDAWLSAARSGGQNGTITEEVSASATLPPARSETPDELMDRAAKEVDSTLAAELIGIVQTVDPKRFEQIVLDLLRAMGYGAGFLGSHQMTKATGDGGIDGIIHEDALGLDAVYIQAKRYAADIRVGRPAIQQFIGSLTGEGATKGVFVTTSDFSREARDYLTKVQHRVVLINGTELAGLMIRHGVGVRDRKTYVIRSVDEDYFADPEG
jgi:restriction system protein